jgi:hypothetical protein
MVEDPIVEDIYRARQKILDRYNGDLMEWMDYLKSAEERHPHRLVTLEDVQSKQDDIQIPLSAESPD